MNGVHRYTPFFSAFMHLQDKVFDSPTVLLCNAVSGEEEIPEGVQAVLVRSAAVSPDILSHVSVRARNAHVLLAVCFDEAESGKLVRQSFSDALLMTHCMLTSPLQTVSVWCKALPCFDRTLQLISRDENLWFISGEVGRPVGRGGFHAGRQLFDCLTCNGSETRPINNSSMFKLLRQKSFPAGS